MKFGTGIKLDVFHIMGNRKVCDVTTINYDVITCRPKFQMSPNPFTDLAEIWYSEVFSGTCFKYQVYRETYGTITSENLEYSLTNSLLW